MVVALDVLGSVRRVAAPASRVFSMAAAKDAFPTVVAPAGLVLHPVHRLRPHHHQAELVRVI